MMEPKQGCVTRVPSFKQQLQLITLHGLRNFNDQSVRYMQELKCVRETTKELEEMKGLNKHCQLL